MVWATIKAVYGYAIKLEDLNDPTLLDDEEMLNYDAIYNKFGLIKPDLNSTPEWISNLKNAPKSNDQLIKIYRPGMNGDGIAVGRRPIQNNISDKFVNAWHSHNIIDNTLDYSIPEFEHYVDKNNFRHYNLLHRFPCCSESNNKYIVLGVTYDEVDRNLFLDSKFDDICTNVFNNPTQIVDLPDTFFQHDSRSFKSPYDLKYGDYDACIHSEPGIRKHELLNVPESINNYVNTFHSIYPDIFTTRPACYLMLDDCTSCT